MLQLLHIENIAVIQEADISFQPGFNALTGETGAGKSIVIDALGAVLGSRTSRDLIRTGAGKAFVSAEFTGVPSDLPGLVENGITPDEDGRAAAAAGRSWRMERTSAGSTAGPSPWPNCARSAMNC